MSGAITVLRIEGQHGSISDLEWRDVPPFAVITGVNGTGKSQLLEVIAASHGIALRPDSLGTSTLQVNAKAHIEGASFAPGEVFHTYGEWGQLVGGSAIHEDVREALRTTYNQGTAPPAPGLSYPGTAPSQKYPSIAWAVATRAGIPIEDVAQLSREEFAGNLTPTLLWSQLGGGPSPPAPQNLAFLFLSYQMFEWYALNNGRPREEVLKLYGEPPWELLNEILETSGLPFRVDPPESIRLNMLVPPDALEIRLRDTERGLDVPMEGLSSGERVIMSTVLWQYGAQLTRGHYKLLLLDEPDAHLHPSLTRRFLKVVRKVFVEERGVRVIMTTHSPSTVSLAPEESLFEMCRTGEPRIRPASSKERLVATLTDGFVAVQEATQTVLVEGKNDPPFYNRVWELLSECSGISKPGPLEPYPSLAFIHGKGKQTVEVLISQMRAFGLSSFHGIIDKDLGNEASDGVYVLRRNAVENYLCDPINVWVSLHLHNQAPAVDAVEVPHGRSAFVRDLPDDDLQKIADTVLSRVESEFTDLSSEERTTEEVAFTNGTRLSYPRWLLEHDDKEVMEAFKEAYEERYVRRERLLDTYATLNMVPEELLELFRKIQASGRP